MIKKNKSKLSINKSVSLVLVVGALLVNIFSINARQTFAENESGMANASSTERVLSDGAVSTSTETTSTNLIIDSTISTTTTDIILNIDQSFSTTTATTTDDTSATTEAIPDVASTTPEINITTSTSTDLVISTTTTDIDITATSTEEVIATTTDEISTTLKSIAIRTLPKNRTFSVNDPLNIVGLVCHGTFSDGSIKIVPISPAPDMANVIGFDSSVSVSNQTITIKYEGVATFYTIDIL